MMIKKHPPTIAVMIKKRPLTILELLISMTLTLFLVSTMMYFYSQASKMSVEMDKIQNESFEMRYVENRLGKIIPRALNSIEQNGDFLFATSSDLGGLFMPGTESLLLTFDNGVKLDKVFAYRVIGRLYLDPKGQLTLAIWPIKKRWEEDKTPPIHKEVLMDKVKGLKFSFYFPPNKGVKKIKNKEKSKEKFQKLAEKLSAGWVEKWLIEYDQLPAIVKIELTREIDGKDVLLTYAYPIPQTLQPITFDN